MVAQLEDHPSQYPQAYISTPSANHDSSSYLNSGVGKPTVGNGSVLPITHIGHASFSANRPLFLRNILLVSDIQKNLISISQFTLHNDLIVEFDASHLRSTDTDTAMEGYGDMTNFKKPRYILRQGHDIIR